MNYRKKYPHEITVEKIIWKIIKRKYTNLYGEVKNDLKKIGPKNKIKKEIIEYEYIKKRYIDFNVIDFINKFLNLCLLVILPIYISFLSNIIWEVFSENKAKGMNVNEVLKNTFNYANTLSENLIIIIFFFTFIVVIFKSIILLIIDNIAISKKRAIIILKEIVETIA